LRCAWSAAEPRERAPKEGVERQALLPHCINDRVMAGLVPAITVFKL
jgi:hypothetical protein